MMPDLDDAALATSEKVACEKAVELLKECWAMRPLPGRDGNRVLRHGYGRPIEVRPQSRKVAAAALLDDVEWSQGVLRGRVFELLAVHPEAQPKLPYIYALADILGPERMRDWGELWAVIRRGDWEAAVAELLVCNWDTLYGANANDRRAVVKLVLGLERAETE
ncbi:hypothetical protein [Xanthomonas translucens]|uniref:Lysozyme n=2 Tax=Xanthomonas campestris pv. translucens TaxID=343 RepID=A0A120EZ65_XANCT|nr:hypothetical protein [Xanthomonas translucens]KWV17147.1 hypothetical protein ATB53_00260 [Xanthomonas translucens]MCT8316480.1 hypothetical protein [Xanthomonas translucens pv. undulosa]QEN93634.1 hypothetical protein F0H33_09810 [Xanthomonas translucens pv. undulosa]QSQ34697.1 hypothetical protein ISN31_03465 [Xanthomonas translucens pv. translucens]WLA02797.1 hypothetical protein MO330_09930 [Xanthomonas translucens]